MLDAGRQCMKVTVAGPEPASPRTKRGVLSLHHPGPVLRWWGVLGGALQATNFTLGALAEGHLCPALLRTVRQHAPFEGCYLPAAGGALFGKLSHGRYVSSSGPSLYATPQHVVWPYVRPGVLVDPPGVRGSGAMQDPANVLRRIILPRRWVNKVRRRQ
jgi:hypothetical protein